MVLAGERAELGVVHGPVLFRVDERESPGLPLRISERSEPRAVLVREEVDVAEPEGELVPLRPDVDLGRVEPHLPPRPEDLRDAGPGFVGEADVAEGGDEDRVAGVGAVAAEEVAAGDAGVAGVPEVAPLVVAEDEGRLGLGVVGVDEEVDERLPHGDLRGPLAPADALPQAERVGEVPDEARVDGLEGAEEVPLPRHPVRPPLLLGAVLREAAEVDEVASPPVAERFAGAEEEEAGNGKPLLPRLTIAAVRAEGLEEAEVVVAVPGGAGVLGLVAAAVAGERIEVEVAERVAREDGGVGGDVGRLAHYPVHLLLGASVVPAVAAEVGAVVGVTTDEDRAVPPRSRRHADDEQLLPVQLLERGIVRPTDRRADLLGVTDLVEEVLQAEVGILEPLRLEVAVRFPYADDEPPTIGVGERAHCWPQIIR